MDQNPYQAPQTDSHEAGWVDRAGIFFVSGFTAMCAAIVAYHVADWLVHLVRFESLAPEMADGIRFYAPRAACVFVGLVWLTLWQATAVQNARFLGVNSHGVLRWTLIEGMSDDGPILVRHCDFPDSFPRRDFPHRLKIFWTMSSFSANGMPEDCESDRMRVFEDRLVEATEADQQAVLSLVLTANGQREYVFHARNPEEFVRRLTSMPQESEPYPIEIHHTSDDTWEYVTRVLGDFACE